MVTVVCVCAYVPKCVGAWEDSVQPSTLPLWVESTLDIKVSAHGSCIRQKNVHSHPNTYRLIPPSTHTSTCTRTTKSPDEAGADRCRYERALTRASESDRRRPSYTLARTHLHDMHRVASPLPGLVRSTPGSWYSAPGASWGKIALNKLTKGSTVYAGTRRSWE